MHKTASLPLERCEEEFLGLGTVWSASKLRANGMGKEVLSKISDDADSETKSDLDHVDNEHKLSSSNSRKTLNHFNSGQNGHVVVRLVRSQLKPNLNNISTVSEQ